MQPSHVMAFCGDDPGTFWLGLKHDSRGSSQGVQYEIQWYIEVEGQANVYQFEFDDSHSNDLMRAERVLVEDVSLLSTGQDGLFKLAQKSVNDIDVALAERHASGAEWDGANSDDDLP